MTEACALPLPVCAIATMEGSHSCVGCGAALQAGDGHDLCPSCLGLDHLREALSENPCMNCSYMPRAVRTARLAQLSEGDLPPSGQVALAPRGRPKRRGTSTAVAAPPRKRARSNEALSSRVEQLSAELAEMRSFFQANQTAIPTEEEGLCTPPMPVLVSEDDAISLAASASYFQESDDEHASLASEAGSSSSAQGSSSEAGDSSVQSVMRMALDCLKLEIPQQTEPGPGSAFFRRGRAPSAFVVPPSEEYLRELHACWRDPGALSRLSADGRVLAAMHNAAGAGLDRMPGVEPAIASLIVSPDEALRQSVRCPRPQCRVTDDLISRAYNAGARAGRLGNSLAHLMFALSSSLQGEGAAANSIGFSDAALQAFALLTRELGRVMSFLVQARRQVWLAQSPLTEACRRTLRSVPVEPGEMFGSAALEALERTIQARQTRQQLSSLNRTMPPPSRSRGPTARSRVRQMPQTHPGSNYYPHQPQQMSSRDFREPARPPLRQPRAQEPGRRPPRAPSAPRGRGARN